MFTCFGCGGQVYWNSDFMGDEVYGDGYEEENGETIVSFYTCSCCGAEYEVNYPVG